MTNQDVEKIRVQLLNIMTASKGILDARRSQNARVMEAAVVKLQHEYVQSIVLMKSLDNSSKIPALLRPATSALERQMHKFSEELSVALDEE